MNGEIKKMYPGTIDGVARTADNLFKEMMSLPFLAYSVHEKIVQEKYNALFFALQAFLNNTGYNYGMPPQDFHPNN